MLKPFLHLSKGTQLVPLCRRFGHLQKRMLKLAHVMRQACLLCHDASRLVTVRWGCPCASAWTSPSDSEQAGLRSCVLRRGAGCTSDILDWIRAGVFELFGRACMLCHCAKRASKQLNCNSASLLCLDRLAGCATVPSMPARF